MQSIASLMSIGRGSDIGNLEDMDEEDEEVKADTLRRQKETSTKICQLASEYDFLQDKPEEEETTANMFALSPDMMRTNSSMS